MLKRIICWFKGHQASPPIKVAPRTYEQKCRRCGLRRWEMWSDGSMGEVTYTSWTK